jgi:hypothetical protein
VDFQDTSRGGRVLDNNKVLLFEENVVKVIEALKSSVLAISNAAESNFRNIREASWYSADPSKAANWIMAVHKLRLYLNEYHTVLVESSMSRVPDKLAINTWVLFWIPFVSDIIQYRIPEIWRRVPGKYVSMFNIWTRAWEALGNALIKIPCHMVFTGEARQKYCNVNVFSTNNG